MEKIFYDPCYIEGEYIWFPRKSGDQDLGLKKELVFAVEPNQENDNFSIVHYTGGVKKQRVLKVYEPAKRVARTLWGKGNFKKKKGMYMSK